MSKYEIRKRTLDVFSTLWWKYIPGNIITVKWPVGTIRVPNGDNTGMMTVSADPNDHYRPWLEKNVGKQGWDWDWRIGPVAADNGTGIRGYDTLLIKFRRKHTETAMMAKLMWV